MGSPESPRENRDSVVNCDSVLVFFARGGQKTRKDHDAEEQAARDDDKVAEEVVGALQLLASSDFLFSLVALVLLRSVVIGVASYL